MMEWIPYLAVSAVESRTISTTAETLAGAASQIGGVEATTERIVLAWRELVITNAKDQTIGIIP